MNQILLQLLQNNCNCPSCTKSRMVDTSKILYLKGPYECPICSEYTRGIYRLQCGHDICPECANKWKNECIKNLKPITCPMCRLSDVLFGYTKNKKRSINKRSIKKRTIKKRSKKN